MNAPTPETRCRLTVRDRQILEHVGRYRLTTADVLRHAVLTGLSRNAVTKIVTRLCDGNYIQKYTLLHPTQYFVLGAVGANVLGLGLHRAAPLGPQSLPMEYAVLLYATLGKHPRTRLTKAEVLSRCPWLGPALADAPHCADEQHGVLELVRVDLGGPADHVARKCVADLTERRRLRDFSPLLAQGRFRLVIITATKEKVTAVRQALDRHDWPDGLLIHFSVISQLLSLSVSRNHA